MIAGYASIGHGRLPSGGYDPGTQTGGVHEHVQARKVVGHAAVELARLHVPHRADRCPDGANAHSPNWSGSAIRANSIGGLEVAVEVHFDWIRAPRGGFGIHDGSSAGRALADAIAAQWKAAGLPRRAHQNRPGLGFIRNTRATAILWECDRIGPYTDAQLATMGRAIARGIATVTDTRLVDEDLQEDDPMLEQFSSWARTAAAWAIPRRIITADTKPRSTPTIEQTIVFDHRAAQADARERRARAQLATAWYRRAGVWMDGAGDEDPQARLTRLAREIAHDDRTVADVVRWAPSRGSFTPPPLPAWVALPDLPYEPS